jgi:hypothetical protein
MGRDDPRSGAPIPILSITLWWLACYFGGSERVAPDAASGAL